MEELKSKVKEPQVLMEEFEVTMETVQVKVDPNAKKVTKKTNTKGKTKTKAKTNQLSVETFTLEQQESHPDST